MNDCFTRRYGELRGHRIYVHIRYILAYIAFTRSISLFAGTSPQRIVSPLIYTPFHATGDRTVSTQSGADGYIYIYIFHKQNIDAADGGCTS